MLETNESMLSTEKRMSRLTSAKCQNQVTWSRSRFLIRLISHYEGVNALTNEIIWRVSKAEGD
jgi:hypothetical protein